MNFQRTALRSAILLATLCISAAIAAPLPPTFSDNPSSALNERLPVEETALALNLRRQIVSYPGQGAVGTVVIDTAHTYLYYLLGDGKAVRYGIGVGREGFTWAGTETVTRKAEWPDWTPPAEMIVRQPYLARWMAGGEGNPLGARAIYLGNTVYRIHGTNMPDTIGKNISSGCIRMLNADVEDLYERVNVGTKVVVLHGAAAVAVLTSSGKAAGSLTPPGGGFGPSYIY